MWNAANSLDCIDIKECNIFQWNMWTVRILFRRKWNCNISTPKLSQGVYVWNNISLEISCMTWRTQISWDIASDYSEKLHKYIGIPYKESPWSTAACHIILNWKTLNHWGVGITLIFMDLLLDYLRMETVI